MDLFDDTIQDIKSWFDGRMASGEARRFVILPSATGASSSDDRTLEAGRAGIILREDTQVELGHPSMGSCAAALATRRPDLVSDGCITLVGPDITETREAVLPFAQIIIAALKDSAGNAAASQATIEIEEMASLMDRTAHQYAPTDGYMLRSVPNLIWARVGKEACRSGFSLRQLGERLIAAIKKKCQHVAACEVFFVTSSKEDVMQLDDVVELARAKLRKLKTYEIAPDGEFECTREEDCASCPEQVVCDNIRDVLRIRKGDRIITVADDEVIVRRSE
jgi:CO dehydrogenase/acetyl-CoA synthase beta subunit